MNILEYLAAIPDLEGVKLSSQPDKPDGCVTLRQYTATPVEHSFSGVDLIYNVQAISRDVTAQAAYNRILPIADKLKRYTDEIISSTQTSSILDIGRDRANPPRHEWTVNFQIRRLR